MYLTRTTKVLVRHFWVRCNHLKSMLPIPPLFTCYSFSSIINSSPSSSFSFSFSSLKSSPETQRSNISIGTLMSARRRRRLIDSARLPRQPWFPVAAFAERRWLHRVSVAPAALSSSSSSSTVSSNAPYPSPSSLPPSWHHTAAIDKRGGQIYKGKTD